MAARLPIVTLMALTIVARASGADVAPEARALLDRVAAAYKALPAYGDEGEVSLVTSSDPRLTPGRTLTPARTALARPNRVAIDAGTVRVVSDGKTVRTIVPPFRNYRDVPATALVRLDDLAGGPLGSVLGGGPGGRGQAIVLGFLLGDDPVKALVADARSIRVDLGIKEGDKTYDRVDYRPEVGPPLMIWVDAASHLVARVEVGVKPSREDGPLVPGTSLVVDSLTWEAGAIRTTAGAVGEAPFTLEAPAGYAEIARLEKDVARKKAENALIGQPAPEFALNVMDGPGKTRRVRKADLAGKVVVLDFWATWCGPCMAEMPDIARMIAGYAKAEKPVAIVAVSLDQGEGDPDEARALVEKTLKAKALNLEVAPVGSVALDPPGIVGRAFGADAIPLVVLIDAKGVVRHVHVGVTARDVLQDEVDALIAETAKK